MNLDAGQAGNDWFGFHGIILTEWLLTLPVWCKEDEMCSLTILNIFFIPAHIYVDIN